MITGTKGQTVKVDFAEDIRPPMPPRQVNECKENLTPLCAQLNTFL